MLSIIESEAVLDAAREMNRRDVLRLELENGIRDRDDDGVDTELLAEDDDAIWARTEGVEGLRGAKGERRKISGSQYSWGPYPRNRRILADVALAAGWRVEKARALERRCVKRMASHFASGTKTKADSGLLNPTQPTEHGNPFTFQHISWSYLPWYIKSELEEMDPSKIAAVKAAVLDRYEINSKTGKKVLPVYDRDTRRISDDLPVSEAEIERAQEELDNGVRYRAAINMRGGRNYMPPDQVKRRIKAYIVTHEMSQEDYCKAIEVTEEQLESFMKERKERPQLESKVFHNTHAFMNTGRVDAQPPKKKRRRI